MYIYTMRWRARSILAVTQFQMRKTYALYETETHKLTNHKHIHTSSRAIHLREA